MFKSYDLITALLLLFCITQSCNNRGVDKGNSELILKFGEEPCSIDSVGNFLKGITAIKLETDESCIIGEIESIRFTKDCILI